MRLIRFSGILFVIFISISCRSKSPKDTISFQESNQPENSRDDKYKDSSGDVYEVKKKVNEIISSWENKDIDKFFSCLTSDYSYKSIGGVTRNYKERKNKAYEIFADNSYIRIKISDLKIDIEGRTAVAKYYQEYESSTLNENTCKILYLRKENGEWLLYKELSGF